VGFSIFRQLKFATEGRTWGAWWSRDPGPPCS